jgi:acetyl esterase/lipase
MPLERLLAERLAAIQAGVPGVEYDTPYGPGESTPLDVRDQDIPGPHGPIGVRVYRQPNPRTEPAPALVWCHGGGFTFGDLDMPEGDQTSRAVAARTGGTVVSVDYRLVTEDANKYPIPLDDVVAAYSWAVDHAAELGTEPQRIALGGASAGANLVSGAALRLRDAGGPLPPLLLPIYPIVHQELPSYSDELTAKLGEAPPEQLIDLPGVASINDFFLGGAPVEHYAFPALTPDLTGFPRTLIDNDEYDTLRASGEAFGEQLAAAGVDVRVVLVPGVLHGHLNLIGYPPAIETYALMAREISTL